jgi:hypothetical protein
MPSFDEELARMNWLKREGKVRGNERCKVIFPALDAKERIKNPNKNKRIVIVTDEFSYSQFAARREAWMQALDNNPSFFMAALDTAMKEFDLIGWRERHESGAESLADA